MPHQLNKTIFEGIELSKANKAMIFVHGRGASAQNILPLADELTVRNSHCLIAPNATNNTWYPQSFVAPVEQNQPYLNAALEVLGELVKQVKNAGINTEDIHFLGFSQGACLVSEFVARNAMKYGSLHIYSGGLIGQQLQKANYSGNFEGMPILLGCSDIDSHIPLQRVHESTSIFKEMGANVDERIYPNAPHTIFQDEIEASKSILSDLN